MTKWNRARGWAMGCANKTNSERILRELYGMASKTLSSDFKKILNIDQQS